MQKLMMASHGAEKAGISDKSYKELHSLIAGLAILGERFWVASLCKLIVSWGPHVELVSFTEFTSYDETRMTIGMRAKGKFVCTEYGSIVWDQQGDGVVGGKVPGPDYKFKHVAKLFQVLTHYGLLFKVEDQYISI